MLIGFCCPDEQKTIMTSCLAKCRIRRRCLTLPTLVSIAWQREYTGKPSTTQCINGTRYEYLKHTKPYYIDPKSMAFALLGTRHHGRLESISAKLNVLSEEKLSDKETTGILDLLEPDETEKDKYVLTDYKTAGSYKVASALGMIKADKKPNPNGETYKSSGAWGKAGSPKMIDTWDIDASKADMNDWELQLNNYRLKVEDCGFPISRLQIQATVRDGGTMTAYQRGIMGNIYMISVKRLEDDFVQTYFSQKSKALIDAIKNDTCPSKCNDTENWGGVRCNKFCEVKEYCK